MSIHLRQAISLLIVLCAAFAGSSRADESVKSEQTSGSTSTRAVCGGEIERSVWALWDEKGRAWANDQLLAKRLRDQGDSYALYDLEASFHNLLAMAVRCNRSDRLLQFAEDWGVAYRSLSAKVAGAQATDARGKTAETNGRGWICRGGAVCNKKNALQDTEVVLVSAQGMGLLSQLASSLALQVRTEASDRFVEETAQVAVEQLARWIDENRREVWRKSIQMRAEDISDTSSKYFFTDRELWMIGMYADLAGMLNSNSKAKKLLLSDPIVLKHHQEALKLLLTFFRARTSLQEVNSKWTGRTLAADIDRGFWRYHADNRFAGYQESKKPAVCSTEEKSAPAVLSMSPEKIASVPTIGWDLSHARRLVHVLESLEKNRTAMRSVFMVSESDLPDPRIARNFAAALVSRVWNGDVARPKFTNYWDGSNGWYRVAYENGTGRCSGGYPPFGLSDSFPTGGYATWGKFYPILSEIGLRIFDAADPKALDKDEYVRQFYPILGLGASVNTRVIGSLMFWPSLVGVH